MAAGSATRPPVIHKQRSREVISKGKQKVEVYGTYRTIGSEEVADSALVERLQHRRRYCVTLSRSCSGSSLAGDVCHHLQVREEAGADGLVPVRSSLDEGCIGCHIDTRPQI